MLRTTRRGRRVRTKNKRLRRRHNRIRNVVPQGAAPVAKKHIVKLKYTELHSLTIPTVTTNNSTVYNLNGLFLPYQPGGGHQPYGFDQLAGLFAHYRVFRTSWHVSFAGSDRRLHLCVVPVNGITVPTTHGEAGEQPLAVVKAMSFSGGFPVSFKGSVSLPKLTGASSVQYKTDDRYSALCTANPTEVMRLYILVSNPETVSATTSFSISLSYWCEFYDPITQAQST